MSSDAWADEERRYDMLPPWAWRRPTSEAERLAHQIATLERLIRENDRAMADNFARLARLQQRHRENKSELAALLAAHRVELRRLR
jgi:cell division septum initiation protein DivIVA